MQCAIKVSFFSEEKTHNSHFTCRDAEKLSTVIVIIAPSYFSKKQQGECNSFQEMGTWGYLSITITKRGCTVKAMKREPVEKVLDSESHARLKFASQLPILLAICIRSDYTPLTSFSGRSWGIVTVSSHNLPKASILYFVLLIEGHMNS